MKLAIDCTFFSHEEAKSQKLSLSTSIFTADILDAFVQLGISDFFTLIINYNHYNFFKHRFPNFNLKILKFSPLKIANKLTFGRFKGTKYLKKFGLFRYSVEKSDFDGIWFPYCVDHTFVKTSLPTICTIHDIYKVHLKGTNGWNFITDNNCMLTTISDYTKYDVIKTFNLQKKRSISITKIPNSIVFDVSKQIPVKGLENKKFILNLNAYIQKKNPMTLLKAFYLIKDKINCDLIFCGGYKEEETWNELNSFIQQNKLTSRVHLLFRVTDEERNWLLTHASLFVTPSLFEGFGRTPVEAAICKIPVISTKETSLYEATMGLCSYVENPTDEKELSELILKKYTTPENKEKLSQISESLSKNYNSINLAKKYLKLFQSITKN